MCLDGMPLRLAALRWEICRKLLSFGTQFQHEREVAKKDEGRHRKQHGNHRDLASASAVHRNVTVASFQGRAHFAPQPSLHLRRTRVLKQGIL